MISIRAFSWSCSCTMGTKALPHQIPSSMFQLHIECTIPKSMLLYIQCRALLHIQFKALLSFHHEDHKHISKGSLHISCACATPPGASWFDSSQTSSHRITIRIAPDAVEKVPDTHCQQLTWLEAPAIDEPLELKHMMLEQCTSSMIKGPTRNSNSSNVYNTATGIP